MSEADQAPPVVLTVADGVATIALNRPSVGNALDIPLSQALRVAVDEAGDRDDVRAVLVVGQGKRFCAGGDIASFVAAEDRGAHLNRLATIADTAVQRLETLDKPVVAAVQGAVAGAGLGLMLAADVVVAEESTKFVTAYAGIGLTPDCGVSYLLPRAVGQQRALDLLLTGRVLLAPEAAEWGLVSRVVADGAAHDEARTLAVTLAEGPSPAMGWARRLARQSWETSRSASGREEARTIALAAGSADAVSRVDVFLRR